MGASCMGEPRKHRFIMLGQQKPQSRYSSLTNPAQSQSKAVLGQSEGNRLKIDKSLLSCSLCMENYNILQREPLFACPNAHTYCRSCCNDVAKTSNKCPECRQPLRPPLRNRDLYQLVEDNANALQSGQLQPAEEETAFVSLSVDCEGELMEDFWVEGSRVQKVKHDCVWAGFMSRQVLPKDRKSYFTIRVLLSRFNNIEVGIVGQGYKLQRGKTCPEAVVLHLADGMVLEGVKGRSSQWKQKATALPKSTSVIEVHIDPELSQVSWSQNGNQLGCARWSDYLVGHPFVAYFLMTHTQDILELNG